MKRATVGLLLLLVAGLAGFVEWPGAGSLRAAESQIEVIRDKAERAKAGVKAHARAGGDPAPMLKLMRQVQPNLQEGDLDEAEALLDEVLGMLESDGGGPAEEAPEAASAGGPAGRDFGNPRRVEIVGYDGDAMEPFISRDDRYLFFNSLNGPGVNTNLYYAERIDEESFRFAGEVRGVNTRALEGVPSMDAEQRFYFTSPRKVEVGNSTIFSGRFADGEVTGADLVPGNLSRRTRGWFALGAEVSADGQTLYYVQAERGNKPGPPKSMNLKVAHLQDGRFEPAPDSDEIFEKVNSDELDYAPAISGDELELWFTRAEQLIVGKQTAGRKLRIYMARRESRDAPFGAPQLIEAIEGFVEGPTIRSDGKTLYYHKKEGDRFVIYKVERGG